MDYMDALGPCAKCGKDRWAGHVHTCPELQVFATLREANAARQKLWGGDLQDGSYRSNELAGEAGEALDEALLALMVGVRVGRVANMVKKLERERLGLPGSRVPVARLAKELGDLSICTDLLAQKYGINLDQATADKFNETSETMGFDVRLFRPADLEPKPPFNKHGFS